MDKETSREYEKVKDLISEQEFLESIDVLWEKHSRPSFIKKIDCARMVVGQLIIDEPIYKKKEDEKEYYKLEDDEYFPDEREVHDLIFEQIDEEQDEHLDDLIDEGLIESRDEASYERKYEDLSDEYYYEE